MLGDKRIMRGTLRQNFMFKSKTCEMCIVDLNIAKALGDMHIHTFLFQLLDCSETRFIYVAHTNMHCGGMKDIIDFFEYFHNRQ